MGSVTLSRPVTLPPHSCHSFYFHRQTPHGMKFTDHLSASNGTMTTSGAALSAAGDTPFASNKHLDLWPGRLTSGKTPFSELFLGKWCCWQGVVHYHCLPTPGAKNSNAQTNIAATSPGDREVDIMAPKSDDHTMIVDGRTVNQ